MTNPDPKQTVDSELEGLFKKHVKWSYSNGSMGSSREVHYYSVHNLVALKAALLARERRLVLEGQKEVLQKINARSSGGGNWRRNIISEVAQLDALLSQKGKYHE